MKRVGADVASHAYWAQKSQSYIDALDGPYHRNRAAMILSLIENVDFAGTLCVDLGCGEGMFAKLLADRGARVIGVDIDETMIAAADRMAAGDERLRFSRGGIERLSELGDASVDHVLSLNVLAYLSASEETRFYTESARILKAGGGLTVTHSNELFDMYTLNRYTVEFFRRNFASAGTVPDVRPLLTNPDKPERVTFSVRENPLAYRYKLQSFGFEERRQAFANHHPLPPLITPHMNFDDINSRSYADTVAWPESERWKLYFQCSMFGSFSTRAAD